MQEREDRLFWANIDVARDCAGEPGTVKPHGAKIVWYSGPEDPLPMICDEIRASHRRIEALVGETEIVDPPLRVMCFHNRVALSKFQMRKFFALDFTAEPRTEFERPRNTMVLCIDDFSRRIDDLRRSGKCL